MTTPLLIGGAVVYRSGLSVDADGAPNAYHWNSALGLDKLGNAKRKDGSWVGVALNGAGQPFVQQPGDPFPGFYISQTALVDRSKRINDPARYVDATLYPYVSIPPELMCGATRVQLGDVAWVVYDGKACGAVVAEVGPSNEYGEGSIALAQALGINPDARVGGCSSGVSWILFPGSAKGWPRIVDDFQAQASDLYLSWGGDAKLATI